MTPPQIQYQLVCLDAGGVARVGDLTTSYEQAIDDLRQRRKLLKATGSQSDRQQWVKVMITHYERVDVVK